MTSAAVRLGAVTLAFSVALVSGLSACSTLPPPSPSLTAAPSLGQEKGVLARRREFADVGQLAEIRRVHLADVEIGAFKGGGGRPQQELDRVANAAARATCHSLAKRYEIADATGPGVLDVRIRLTEVRATGRTMVVAGLFLPVRPPLGLGGLSAEGEAVLSTLDGPRPIAAMVWSRRADILSGGRPSTAGDAYDFASDFGSRFGDLITQETLTRRGGPVAAGRPSPKLACARYGDTRVAADLLYFFGAPVTPAMTEPSHPTQSGVHR